MGLLITPSTDVALAHEALPLLDGLEQYYPGFESWFSNKVVPGLAAGKDVLLLAREHEEGPVVGLALGKKGEETKLRCVRVHPDFQQTGLGIRLIDRMLEELGERRPHCTVSEEMLHAYSRAFVARYGFALSDVKKGAYRPGRLEYFWN